jgi:serine/threonine protein kinase
MELLGKNISSYKKSKGKNFTSIESIDILIQMLGCIEEVHNKGYIHRDIKPSNFVMDLTEKKVFIVDFGISKLHLDTQGNVFPKRAKVDFRGTLSYASLNSHQKIVKTN